MALYMPSDPIISYDLWHIFHNIVHQVGFPYPMVLGLAHRIYDERIDWMGYTSYGVFMRERIVFRDVIQNAFVTVLEDAKFHASCE
jgi:hypothetical protein